MVDQTTCTAFLTQILFFVFLSLFTWSHISGECVCHSFTCRCTNVNSIPQLDSNVTSVIIENSHCNLTRKFMANLYTLALEELYFRYTYIKNSEKDFFRNFPNLRKLTFEDIRIYISVLERAFNSLHVTNISKLEIFGVNLSPSLSSLLMTLNGTNITELSLVRCQLTTFNCTNFISSLKHLQYLDLSYNLIDQASWSHTNHLQVLNIYHSRINLPAFLASNRTPFFPNLRQLEISAKQIEKINSSTFEGLDNLEYLYFGTFRGTTISSSFLFSIPKLQSLHIDFVDFNYVHVPLTVEYGAFKSEHLQYLELEYFRIDTNYKGSLFRHTPNLLSLRLEFIQIVLLEQELKEELMPLKKLENFTMSRSELQKVPHVLCFMSNLTRIDLGQNNITFWNNTDCPVMSRLQFLSLSKNEIQLIEKNTFSPQLMSNDELIWDLSDNPFLCICRLLWFTNWSLQRQKQLQGYPRGYTCKRPHDLEGKWLNSLVSDGQCTTKNPSTENSSTENPSTENPSTENSSTENSSTENSSIKKPVLIIVLVPIGSLILIATVIATLLYYKRWSIRYLLYLMQSRRKQQNEQEGHNYTFDAFVCYHNSDTEWLLKELCPKLEEENNLSLCIHDRDFIAGWDIVENIVESIENSRKVLLLISNKFACSGWCQFEMTMAHQRVIEQKENIVVVVLLENIDINNQSRRLTLLLKQKTYLEWTDNKEGQALFWHRLISCLKAPKPRHSME